MKRGKSSIPVVDLGLDGETKPIPVIGLGSAQYPLGGLYDVTKQSVLDGIATGHRHFDTAAIYLTEKPIGDAVADALRLGLIKTREELFITSKLWSSSAHPHLVLPALRKTLENLGMEYIDLFLIHWPGSVKPSAGMEFPPKREDVVPMDFKSVWEAMEECQKLGLAKSIGVSNFSTKKLDQLLADAKIPPAVNQVELSPVWQQKRLREYCDAKGIRVAAYSPLGQGSAMECDALKEIANARGKTVAQICLRWVYEQGAILVTKSFNKGRMKESLEIFDWQLTPEDLEKFDHIPQHRVIDSEWGISPGGPFKTLEDIWDE